MIKRGKIYLNQERWLKFSGEHSSTRGILNFFAEGIILGLDNGVRMYWLYNAPIHTGWKSFNFSFEEEKLNIRFFVAMQTVVFKFDKSTK